MSQKTVPVKEIYTKGCLLLKEAGIEEADLDAWWLLSHITGIDKTKYYTEPAYPVSEEDCKIYWECVKKRKMRIPLQHIVKEQEFMGLTFQVNEHVLIPRQDTEVLVEESSRCLGEGMRILDLCTGSGCILISLAEEARQRGFQGMHFTGTDISKEALRVAEENGRRHRVIATWVESNLFGQIEGAFDLIVSNPPYIKTEVIKELEEEVRCHDPFIALDGKEDGLHFYRIIIEKAYKYLNDGGWLVFEIGHDQREAVTSFFYQAGFAQIRCQKDLTGLDRVVMGRYNKAKYEEKGIEI